jgi:hypothetical protein
MQMQAFSAWTLPLILWLLAIVSGQDSGQASGQYASTISEVLTHATCESFLPAFNDRGYDEVRLLRKLSDMDLQSLGMSDDDMEK